MKKKGRAILDLCTDLSAVEAIAHDAADEVEKLDAKTKQLRTDVTALLADVAALNKDAAAARRTAEGLASVHSRLQKLEILLSGFTQSGTLKIGG